MKTTRIFFCLAALTAVTLTAAEQDFTLPKEEITLKAGEGVESIKASCLLCHSSDYISTQPPLTKPQWTATVEKMRGKYGAPIATNQVQNLVEYLNSSYGKPAAAK